MHGFGSAGGPYRPVQGRHAEGGELQLPGLGIHGQGGGCGPGGQVHPSQGGPNRQVLRDALTQNPGSLRYD